MSAPGPALHALPRGPGRDAPRVKLDAQRRRRRTAGSCTPQAKHVAGELHVDVGVALQSGGQADALHAAGAVGLEPLVGIDLVAFDSDQAGAGVGRADADLDLVALGIGVLVQAQLQLGVALQRATGVAVVAMPAISTGVYGYPLEEAVPIYCPMQPTKRWAN